MARPIVASGNSATATAAKLLAARRNFFRVLLSAALTGAGAHPADAHHSVAGFDTSKTIVISGELLAFNFANPHSSFIVEGSAVVDGQVSAVGRWEVESDATATLLSSGINASTFKPGERVVITARPHRQAASYALAMSLRTDEGKEYLFRYRGSDRIFSPELQTRLGRTGGREAQAPSGEGVSRIAGRWQEPGVVRGDGSALPLNAAGLAAWRSYDAVQSPANTCEPISVPELWNAPFYLIEVQIDAQAVILRHELYDVVRRVRLDGSSASADEHGQFGVVRGRVDGDALVIESSNYPPSKWGLGIATQVLGGGADVPSSDRKKVTERLTLNENGRTLIVEYSVEDPAYLSGAYNGRVELTRVPEGTAMFPYACDLDSAQRWSRHLRPSP